MRSLTLLLTLFFIISCGSDSTPEPIKQKNETTLSISFAQGSLGLGSVTVEPNNLVCSNGCIYTLAKNSTITLTAISTSNNEFSGWEGDCAGLTTCTLSMNSNKNVTVHFKSSLPEHPLNVSSSNGGEVTFDNGLANCVDICKFSFIQGEQVLLTPKSNDGFTFIGWEGDCTEQELCLLTVEKTTYVKANFTETSRLQTTNFITITEPHGANHTNYPIQIARPFIKGEIENYPQALRNGALIPTQVDVKQRHEDGSVKHAIISFILPSLMANSTEKITFINKDNNDNTPLSKVSILENENINAYMFFNFPTSETISARKMISNDHFKYWIQGPIATSIIIADHSIDRIYDVGNDDHRSVRPIFHLTIWPTINKYSVRYIAEVINTEALQDQKYDISLTIESAENIIYQKDDIHHQARTRWTQKFWSGEAVRPLTINHNVNYLTQTNSVPNFDVSRVQSQKDIEDYWKAWLSKNTDIYEKGLWQPYMPSAGGRADIGLYPTWSVKWLFSGDWRLQTIALKQSELASAWPIHLREGSHTRESGTVIRKYDFEEKNNALGKTLSIAPKARPTHWVDRPQWYEIFPDDKVVFLNNESNPRDFQHYNGSKVWHPDTAHHPDIASLQFLLTGDYYFLQQMLFSSAFVTSDNNAKGFTSTLGRGPTGSEGALYSGQPRGSAWALRTRVHTYDIVPDNLPEKQYLHRLNKNAISMFEALQGLSLTNKANQNIYNFVRDKVLSKEFSKTLTPSSLGLWEEGVDSISYVNSTSMDTNQVSHAVAPWQLNFIIIALGRAKELGYNTDNLLSFVGQHLLGPFQYPELNHAVGLGVIALPSLNNNNEWFTSWQEIYRLFSKEYTSKVHNFVLESQDAEHGYPSIAMAAAAYLNGKKNHDQLWQYVNKYIANKSIYEANPKWAIKPKYD